MLHCNALAAGLKSCANKRKEMSMAYKVTIYDVVDEVVVKDEDEADEIVDYEGRVNNRLTKVEEVSDDELPEEEESK